MTFLNELAPPFTISPETNTLVIWEYVVEGKYESSAIFDVTATPTVEEGTNITPRTPPINTQLVSRQTTTLAFTEKVKEINIKVIIKVWLTPTTDTNKRYS